MNGIGFGRWLRRAVVFVAGSTGLLALVSDHVHGIMQQQHCEPLLRR